MVASGVRSSWEALATNRRCAVNDSSSRPSSSSMVSARSLTSSAGPVTARRRSRLSAEMRRVTAVMSRSGRRTRLASTRPSSTETTAITTSASSEPTSSCRDCCVCTAAS